MYAIRTIPPDRRTDVQGLTIQEAFSRIMALMELEYRFVRTAWEMHLLIAPNPPDAPEFVSGIAADQLSRNAIMAQVCCHDFGRFRVITDDDYRREVAAEDLAA
jgi:hypothetical protein